MCGKRARVGRTLLSAAFDLTVALDSDFLGRDREGHGVQPCRKQPNKDEGFSP